MKFEDFVYYGDLLRAPKSNEFPFSSFQRKEHFYDMVSPKKINRIRVVFIIMV